MAIRIDRKIKNYSVQKPGDQGAPAVPSLPTPLPVASALAEVIQMSEALERPDTLVGATYKVKTPLFEHALYVTINDVVLNAGTEYELRRPFEIFINSKNMDHFQWIVALTRIMSAVFRKGGDVTFLVEELKAVFDPRGGYFKAGCVYMPSIVAEIGAVIEQHMKSIGLIHDPELSDDQRRLIAEKRTAYEARAKKNSELSKIGDQQRKPPAAGGDPPTHIQQLVAANATDDRCAQPAESASDSSGFPPGATHCHKCHTTAVIFMDGCATCLSCGYSKCG
ncbi:MAG: NrdJb [Lysobacterales bacterium]